MRNTYAGLKFYTGISFALLCGVTHVYALDSMTLRVAHISADEWSLNNAELKISRLGSVPQISLVSATLILPPPLQDITTLSIQCQKLIWYENYLDCSGGRAHFNSKLFKTLAFDFSLLVDNDTSRIKLDHFVLFDGEISVLAQEKAGKWQAHIKAENMNLVELQARFAIELLEITQGVIDFDIELTGQHDSVQTMLASALLKNLSVHDQEGHLASENVKLKTQLSLLNNKACWQWHNINHILGGELYVEPVFLQVDNSNPIALSANGFWRPEIEKIQVDEFKLDHPDILAVQASASLNYHAVPSVEEADVSVDIPRLKIAAPIYLLPFLESGVFADIDLSGSVVSRLKVLQNSVLEADIRIKELSLEHTEQGLHINQANAQINWASQQNNTQASYINWQQFKIKAIPFQAGQLDFISFDRQIKLLKQVDLAVLGGVLSINNFSFTAAEQNRESTVQFDGSINKLSMEQLSTALDWTPLTGTISGYVPSVSYQENTLSLDGELKMQVFDGVVRVKNLASSGLFSGLPQFYADIAFDNLDLGTMTQKFHTGYIEGRLSGFVQNLYLESWEPVSFYAWLGTPEDDDSTHRISQKAVENIASIGGGGATDVLSRGFLGLFSTFGYRKLGIGCYLHQGVCQLMGIEAVDNGFYLVKGGGLPRIDVIGYTPRLDWAVLIESLKRISASDEVIIE